MKKIFIFFLFLFVVVFGFTLMSCDNDPKTLESLQSEYGIVVDGGDFEKGSILVSNEINAETEEGIQVLTAIEDENYNKEGSIYIFDIHVTKDGSKVQPNGKVKVSIPLPNTQVEDYLVFHIKEDNKVENIIPTITDGKLLFETSSFSYFIVAEKALENHEFGAMYYARRADFFYDGNIAYYQCSKCEKYFDEQYNEVETVVIPKHSTNLSICVNGVPTALVLGEQREGYITWSLEGLSVKKGDVITICQTNNLELTYNYFADGNVGEDKKILTTAGSANVHLTATPNGLMLFIDGYKYEGIVVEINGTQYPMEYVTYPDGQTTTYIYGYVYFSEGDEFVIIDNVNDVIYDYDDLSDEYNWDTWDFHRGDNGQFVIDYTGRYGLEFDYDNNNEIFINKVFRPLDGDEYQIVFDNLDSESIDMEEKNISSSSEAHNDLLWYIEHEKVINNEDICSYIDVHGFYLYTATVYLEEGTKFNIKNITSNITITAENLTEAYIETGAITKDGEYIKILASDNYKIMYMPCYNAFSIENVASSELADVYMYLDGNFIPLTKGTDNLVTYEGLVADAYTNIMFTNSSYTVYLPITISSETDSSYAHIIESSGINMLFFDKAGTYNLSYNAETGVLNIVSTSLDEEDSTVTYLYYLSVIDLVNGNSTNTLSKNADNDKEYYIKNVSMLENNFMFILAYGDDDSSASYYTLSDTDAAIATTSGSYIVINASGTYDIYFNTQNKTIRIVE